MALVTGTLSHFGLAPMAPYAPKILFVPSGPAVTGTNYIVTSRPIAVHLDGFTSEFEVDLLPNIATRPFTFYSIRIEWLNGAGIPTGLDVPGWKLIVPPEGGDIATLMDTPPTALEVHVGETDDPRFGFWFQPSTSLLRS